MKTLIIFEIIHLKTAKVVIDLSEEDFNFLTKANNYTANVSEFNQEAHDAFLAIEAGFHTYEKLVDPSHAKWLGMFVENALYTPPREATDVTGVERLIFTRFLPHRFMQNNLL